MNECYHGILLDFIQCQCDVCKWSEEFDQDEMSAEVEAENGYGEEE